MERKTPFDIKSFLQFNAFQITEMLHQPEEVSFDISLDKIRDWVHGKHSEEEANQLIERFQKSPQLRKSVFDYFHSDEYALDQDRRLAELESQDQDINLHVVLKSKSGDVWNLNIRPGESELVFKIQLGQTYTLEDVEGNPIWEQILPEDIQKEEDETLPEAVERGDLVKLHLAQFRPEDAIEQYFVPEENLAIDLHLKNTKTKELVLVITYF